MTETTTAPPANDAIIETKTFGTPVSAGKPSPVQLNVPGSLGAEQAIAPTVDLPPAGPAPERVALPEITEEQLTEILKSRGIEIGLDEIKEKIKPAAAATPEATAEEKAKAEAAFEKRMLDYFIANGGTPETFVAYKHVANADRKALSESEIRRELKDSGFSEEDIAAVLKERYYQINPEELVWDEDGTETKEEFEKRKALIEKKIAFGTKKLESKSSFIKKQAEDALGVLREAIAEQDLQKAEEVKISSKVDELATKLPRKLTFDLGEVNNQKIAPIQYDVSEADIAEIVGTLKDPVQRNNFLYNEDNSLNLDNVANVMLRNKYLESALKASYLEGGTRQVSEFEKIFPGRTAQSIGVGGANGGTQTGRKGHIVSAGKPQPIVRNT